jgi:hypothetical protein
VESYDHENKDKAVLKNVPIKAFGKRIIEKILSF